MKHLIRKYFTHQIPRPLKNIFLKNNKRTYAIGKIATFGNKNTNKIFYIIKRNKGSGFFSNVHFILSHLLIADKFSFIPIIDMKNFKTIYNDNSASLKNKNAWEYYFKKINKYKLSDVYKSKNLIFSSDFLPNNKAFNYEYDKNYEKIFKKYVKIKPSFIRKYKNFSKNKLKEKTLGIHFRGTSYKTAKSHSFQPNIKIMINLTKDLIKKFGYRNIFIITEEKEYLNAFIKNFGNKVVFYNSYRSFRDDAFTSYPRKNHRFNLGKETLIETLILSDCEGIVSNTTNIEKAARFFSKKRQLVHSIYLGTNSRNKYIAIWLWYLKSILPKCLGGLKILRSKNYLSKN